MECDNCRWFYRYNSSTMGNCQRRSPPQGGWPIVNYQDSCEEGEIKIECDTCKWHISGYCKHPSVAKDALSSGDAVYNWDCCGDHSPND